MVVAEVAREELVQMQAVEILQEQLEVLESHTLFPGRAFHTQMEVMVDLVMEQLMEHLELQTEAMVVVVVMELHQITVVMVARESSSSRITLLYIQHQPMWLVCTPRP